MKKDDFVFIGGSTFVVAEALSFFQKEHDTKGYKQLI